MSFKMRIFFIAGFFLLSIAGNTSFLHADSDASAKTNAFLEDEDLTNALSALNEDEPSPAPPAAIQRPAAPKVKPSEDPALVDEPDAALVDQFGIKKADKKKTKKTVDAEYDLMEHLPEAEVHLFTSGRESSLSGTWAADHFEFSGMPGADIRIQSFTFVTEPRPVIAVKLLPKQIYQIRFNEVPPFEKMKFEYNLKATTETKAPDYMFLRILVGRYEIKRLQISSKDPWMKQAFKVGVTSFLNSNIPITLEFAAGQASGLTFSLIPEVE